MNEAQKKNKKKGHKIQEDDDKGINDRVFVCLGRFKETNQPHAWVMTLNKTYDEVTFWDVNLPLRYTLIGRIMEGEEANL
jgi:hypothetical protein